MTSDSENDGKIAGQKRRPRGRLRGFFQFLLGAESLLERFQLGFLLLGLRRNEGDRPRQRQQENRAEP